MNAIKFPGTSRLFFRQSSFRKQILNQFHKSSDSNRNQRIKSTVYYLSAAGVLTAGLSYAAVPLYRMFCQAYSYGGTTSVGHDTSKVEAMKPIKHRPIRVRFNADLSSSMRWNFKPQQHEITVCFVSDI